MATDNIKLRAFQRGLASCSGCCCRRHAGAAQSEIEWFPRHECADRAAPDRAKIIADPSNGPRYGRNDSLRQQQTKDVVSRCAIDLGDAVDSRQIGRASQIDSRRSSVDLFLGNGDRRIISNSASSTACSIVNGDGGTVCCAKIKTTALMKERFEDGGDWSFVMECSAFVCI